MQRIGQMAVVTAAVAFGVAFAGMGGGTGVPPLSGNESVTLAGTGGGISTPPASLTLGQHTGIGGISAPEPVQ